MPIEQRTRGRLPSPGPYLAEITNHLDSTYMGGVEVALIRGIPNSVHNKADTYPVQYLSPFYGVTSLRHEGNNSNDFNDVQKSYGMWMVPPDIGTTVMVIFVDGDPNQGYWFGCVQDKYQNHMMPGIAASSNTSLTSEQRKKYGTTLLPVAEFHKKSQTGNTPNVNSYTKPIHPFADRLLSQGLLLDTIRGTTSSSARREIPSGVFGISTPGPLDTSAGAKRGDIGYEGPDHSKRRVPVSRLGGSSFVMDDGDINGQNELIRIRTRTGHQILMHNSQDLIYIANSKGTAWIELTSNGKIDMYAADSVSIHTEADFNLRADRDFNIEAGRNINMNAGHNKNVNVAGDYSFIAQNGVAQFNGNFDQTIGSAMKLTVGSDLNLRAGNIYQTSAGNFHVTGATNSLTASGNTNISSGGTHFETASAIHMNGPTAAKAAAATAASKPTKLKLFALPNRSTGAGWDNGNFYHAGSLTSIMQRVPTHEPYDQHETIDPTRFNVNNTDLVVNSSGGAAANGAANQAWPDPNGNQPADWSNDLEFINRVKEVSKTLGCNYVDLLACMQFESGMNPAQRNLAGGSATGLIQFIESVAKGLGTTTAYLAGLTRTQQMDWVLKYFQGTPLPRVADPTISDVYMGILAPAYCGKPGSYPIYSIANSPKAYYANSVLDINGDGVITKDEAAAFPIKKLAYVKQQLVNAGIEKSS